MVLALLGQKEQLFYIKFFLRPLLPSLLLIPLSINLLAKANDWIRILLS